MTELLPWVADWWKLIDTAPKDGEAIMLYRSEDAHSGGYMVSAYWGEWPAQGRVDHCWIMCSGGPLQGPSHWMPMPPKPRR